jgi:transposase
MHPNSKPRRVYDAPFKTQVMAECQRPDASVAAVALAHGLNVNLVRKWLVGRGLKRSGLRAPRQVAPRQPPAAPTRQTQLTVPTQPAPSLQFVALDLGAPDDECLAAGRAQTRSAVPSGHHIEVDLQRGASRLMVRWPSSQAGECASWLRAVAALLK